MKMDRKRALHCATLGILFSASCALGGQTAHAQSTQERRIPISPAVEDSIRQSNLAAIAAAVDLHAGRYAQAEAEAREAVSLEFLIGMGQEVLAAALAAQGKDKEALQEYHAIVVDQMDHHASNMVPYAQLLLKSGDWKEALSVYNRALSRFPNAELASESAHFSPDVPEPAALAVALHIQRGRLYNAAPNAAGQTQNTEAMAEYGKALQLAPDNVLVNFYYGSGWQRLTPAEKVKFGNAAQARAAFQKAANLGGGDIKKNAEEALKAFAPPR
jgi:tetratricopeptide (TPR) repeat protein